MDGTTYEGANVTTLMGFHDAAAAIMRKHGFEGISHLVVRADYCPVLGPQYAVYNFGDGPSLGSGPHTHKSPSAALSAFEASAIAILASRKEPEIIGSIEGPKTTEAKSGE